MIAIGLKHFFSYNGAQLNVYHANAGQGLPKHSHTWSHAIVCHNGSCLVSLEGRSYTINKNSQPLNLPNLNLVILLKFTALTAAVM
jgi:hypothetical protein